LRRVSVSKAVSNNPAIPLKGKFGLPAVESFNNFLYALSANKISPIFDAFFDRTEYQQVVLSGAILDFR
jgi:hypothetical protein